MIILQYKTNFYIPPLAEITLRTNRNNWQDIAGHFEGGAWQFSLAPEQFSGTFDFKFVLDRAQWMEGDENLTVTTVDGEVYSFGLEGISFPEGGRTKSVREYGQVQRRYFEPPMAATDQLFDVIVIGSGVGGGVLADELSDLGYK